MANVFDKVVGVEQTTSHSSPSVNSISTISQLVGSNEENVINDYDWTLSTNKKLVGDTIPFILLREKKLISSNITTSLFSSIFSLPDALTNNRIASGDVITAVGSVATLGAAAESTMNLIADLIKQTSDIAARKIESVYSSILNKHKSLSPEFNESLQKVLGLLYLTTSTGNIYKFPYFTNELFSVDNSFQDTYQQTSLFDTVDKKAKEISEGMLQITALAEPGTYIQRPKFYNFTSTGTSISFKLTLFNTLNEMSYLKNSNLITKLVLANMPRRLDKITVKPPCIYEVTIPGKAFYPYCFIRNLKVDHIGVKRLVKGNNGKQAIVPDAYSIDITIESLVSDINNLYEQQLGDAGMNLDENEVFRFSDFTKPAEQQPVYDRIDQPDFTRVV